MAPVFLEHRAMLYGITPYLITNNGLQLPGKLFTTLRSFLPLKNSTTPAHFPQPSGQAECYNRISVMKLPYYVAKDQHD